MSRSPKAAPVNELAGMDVSGMHDLRAVMRVTDFRRLFSALALSSLGDWLGLLATTAFAAQLEKGSSAQLYAIGGVLVARLLPSLVLGPLAGAFADRFDRRWTMIISDLLRFALFASIPLVGNLDYLFLANFLAEAFGVFWIPAKEASVPNLLRPEILETANQLSLIATYGTGAVAAGIFALLSSLNRALGSGIGFFHSNPVDLSFYFDAVTFLVAAVTVFGLHSIGGRREPRARGDGAEQLGFWRSIVDGWAFVGKTPLVRGLVVGIVGAFTAGGAVIALGRPYVALLSAGNAAYGLLFGGVFVGLAFGMAVGPRLLGDVSRRRLFGISIMAAGACLAVMAVMSDLVLALLLVVVVTTFSGVAWVTGYTLLGLEVPDDVRGRTFSFVQSLVRIDLLVVLAAAPALAGVIGRHSIVLTHGARIRADGVTLVLLGGGLIAVAVGIYSYRVMDDHAGRTVLSDLRRGLRIGGVQPLRPGFFIAFEGGEGAGKSTQVRRLAATLAELGYDDVVCTFEPGDTPSGAAIRSVLLDPATRLSPTAEALLYAADRAEHVTNVLLPALERGAVVLCDRYVDSSLAYQGRGRGLGIDAVRRLQKPATAGLMPDLTVLLDLPPSVGLARVGAQRDRMETEPTPFHEAVRDGFLELAGHRRGRYVVVAADGDADAVAAAVAGAVRQRLARRRGPHAVGAEPRVVSLPVSGSEEPAAQARV